MQNAHSTESSMKRLLTRRTKKNNKLLVTKLKADYTDDDNANKCIVEFTTAVEKENVVPQFKVREIKITGILILLFSVFSYIFDCGSDYYLIITYLKEGNLVWFGLTLAFVLIPAITMSFFSLIWYWMDNEPLFSSYGWAVRLLMHFVGMAPLVRYIDTLRYAWKCRRAREEVEKNNYYKLMLFEEADSAMLRMMECTMESGPQLLLQLYILFTQPRAFHIRLVVIQAVSSILSLISLSWCLAAYQSSLRLTTPGKAKMSLCTTLVMVVWKLLVVAPRFLAIALFSSAYQVYILVLLGFHYLFMAGYIICQGTTFFSPKKFTIKEILFNLVVALIYCVDFLNVKDGPTRYRHGLYYSVALAEVLCMSVLWYLVSKNSALGRHLAVLHNSTISSTNSSSAINSQTLFYYQSWSPTLRFVVTVAMTMCFLMGIVIMMLYYARLHPTKIHRFVTKPVAQHGDDDLRCMDESRLDSTMAQRDLNSIPTSLSSRSQEDTIS